MMHAMHAMIEDGLTIEEVDKVLGPAMGRQIGRLRTADLVGSTRSSTSPTTCTKSQGRSDRERFLPPPFVKEMAKRGLLGRKTGAGFFKMEGKGDEAQIRPRLQRAGVPPGGEGLFRPSTRRRARRDGGADPESDLRDDKAAKYAWKVLSRRCSTPRSGFRRSPTTWHVDNAMKWGSTEPRPLRDVGRDSGSRLGGQVRRREAIPANVRRCFSSGCLLLSRRNGVQEYSISLGGYLPVPVSPISFTFPPSRSGKKRRRNRGRRSTTSARRPVRGVPHEMTRSTPTSPRC